MPVSNPTRLAGFHAPNNNNTDTITTNSVSPSGNALVIVYLLGNQRSDATATSTFSVTAGGWTRAAFSTQSNCEVSVWWAVTTASPGTGTVTLNSATGSFFSAYFVVEEIASGFDSTTPIGAVVTGANGQLTTTTTPAGTWSATPDSGSLLVGAIDVRKATGSGTTTISAPATGMTSLTGQNAWNNCYDTAYGAGSISSFGWTLSAAPTTSSIAALEVQAAAAAAATLSSPTSASVTQTGATIGATTDDNTGTLYGVVTTSATEPSEAQIKAGQDHTGSAAAGDGTNASLSVGANTIPITGLSAGTTYYYYLLQDNGADSNIVSGTFNTQAAAVPTITSVNGGSAIARGATGVSIVGTNLGAVTGVTIGGVAQTGVSAGATEVTFNLVQGGLKYGTDYTLEITDGANTDTATVQLTPPAGYTYFDVAGLPWGAGEESIFEGASPAVANGDQAEVETTTSLGATLTLNADGTFVIGTPAGEHQFDARVWDATDSTWGAFETFTVTTAATLSSPTVASITQTGATVGCTSDYASGTLYGVITTSVTQPSEAQIKAGQDHTGAAAAWADSDASPTAGANTFAATGLSNGVNYYAHFVQDSGNDSNIVSTAQFTTLFTPAVLSAPTSASVGDTTATVGCSTNDARGTLYAVITTAATQPSEAQIQAGQDHTGAAAAWADSDASLSLGANTFAATGLSSATAYYAHFNQDNGTDSNVVSTAEFTTTTPPPPVGSVPSGGNKRKRCFGFGLMSGR